jgi:hypothetical protein
MCQATATISIWFAVTPLKRASQNRTNDCWASRREKLLYHRFSLATPARALASCAREPGLKLSPLEMGKSLNDTLARLFQAPMNGARDAGYK